MTIPHSSPSAGKFCAGGHLSAVASWDVLGASPLSRTLERFRISGVSEISILREDGTSAQPDSGLGFIDCVPAWDSVVSRYLGYGLKTLLLIRIGPYVELDVTDFLRFHRETSSPVAQVYDQHGALDLFAIDAAHLRDKAGPFRGTLKSQTRYPFVGYTNRLQDVHDFRQLVKDALFGRAAIRPIGRELAANVWVNQDARVDESTRIFGPAYIGRNSRVQADCTIIGASSIEQECEIDCGTTVDDCCILSGTYLGMGLTVRHAVASEHTLLHLGRNVELRFHDRRLMGALRSEARWQVRPSLSAPVPASLDPCSQPTNPNWHL